MLRIEQRYSLHRATSHKQQLGSDPGSVLHGGESRRFPFRWTNARAGEGCGVATAGAAALRHPVVRSTRHMERPTSGAGATSKRQLGDGGHQISLPGAHRESHDPTAQRLFFGRR